MTAALIAPYGGCRAAVCIAAIEEMFSTLPFDAFNAGNASCVACTIAIMSIARLLVQPFSSSDEPNAEALLTRKSTPPRASVAARM